MKLNNTLRQHMLIGITLILCLLMLLSACGLGEAPTPTADRGPILRASDTVLPIMPTEDSSVFVGRSDPDSSGLAAEGEPSQAALTPTPLPTLEVLPLQTVAEDGTVLQFLFYGGKSAQAPAVILLHDVEQDSGEWEMYALPLSQLGYNVFVPDQRGHGRSNGEVNWELAISDIETMIETVTRLNVATPTLWAFIGAGTGANLAAAACPVVANCTTVVALSPQNAESSLAITPAALNRSVFIVSADDDETGTIEAEQLNNGLTGEHFWQRYNSGGRGTTLLVSQPDLPQRLTEWLQTRLGIST